MTIEKDRETLTMDQTSTKKEESAPLVNPQTMSGLRVRTDLKAGQVDPRPIPTTLPHPRDPYESYEN